MSGRLDEGGTTDNTTRSDLTQAVNLVRKDVSPLEVNLNERVTPYRRSAFLIRYTKASNGSGLSNRVKEDRVK